MWVAAVVSVVATVASTAVSAVQSADAAKAQEQGARDAQRLAEMNAMANDRETQQAADNMRGQQQAEEAKNRARASASGISASDTGSFGIVQDAQKATNLDQLAWLKEAGASQSDIIRKQGQNVFDVGMANARASRAEIGSTVAGGIAGVASTAKSAGWLST